MKAYNLMGYDAFTPGDLDFFLGMDELQRLRKKAKFPFLASNLMSAKNDKPLFTPYLIKEIKGVKIGFLGLISKEASAGSPLGQSKEYYLGDPNEVGQKLIAELKNKGCRVIVILGHMEQREQEKLARDIAGIQFILSGHSLYYQTDSIEIGEAQIFFAGSQGEHMGQVDFFIEGKRIYSRYQLITLTTKYPDHPQVQEWLNQYKAYLQSLLAAQPRRSPGDRRKVTIPVTPLFMGEKHCLPCHPQQHQSWLATGHAKAYQTLAQQNKASDPTCLACHSTGFGMVKNTRGYFENVQCEACHGPAEGHPELRKNLRLITDENQCLNCHTRTNSPNFHYPTYFQKISHGKKD